MATGNCSPTLNVKIRQELNDAVGTLMSANKLAYLLHVVEELCDDAWDEGREHEKTQQRVNDEH